MVDAVLGVGVVGGSERGSAAHPVRAPTERVEGVIAPSFRIDRHVRLELLDPGLNEGSS
jgi:hypothetical protein